MTIEDSILELLDNSLDAFTRSCSRSPCYELKVIFLITNDNSIPFKIIIEDNGTGVKESDFAVMTTLGLSGGTSGSNTIGTWGSGLITSGFRLGDSIIIKTANEFTESGPILDYTSLRVFKTTKITSNYTLQ